MSEDKDVSENKVKARPNAEAKTAEAKTSAAKTNNKKKSGWKWSLGLVATGVAGAAVVAFRGCWHRKMSWPVRAQDCSYQVCLGCGIKRLFDEKDFRSYGPYSYDLNHLIALRRAQAEDPTPPLPETAQHRPAS